MKNYFLIARNKSDNSFRVLSINEQWFSDSGNDIFYRCNDLEAIDLVTSQFSNSEEFVERLYSNGYVDSKDIDLFVASTKKKNGKKYIKFNEVIYGFSNNSRISALKDIASSSLHGNILNAVKSIHILYDDLISSVYFSPSIYSMIVNGATNMDLRFLKLLRNIPEFEEIPYDVKYGWDVRCENYRSLRNIVETLNRVKQLNCYFRDDLEEKNEEFIAANELARIALIPELSSVLDKSFSEEQLSLFDENVSEVVDDEKRENGESEKTFSRIDIPRKNVSDDEKKKEIFRVLKTLSLNAFCRSGDKFVVNYSLLDDLVMDDEKRKLNTLLTGNMPLFFANYLIHSYRLKEIQAWGASSYEIGELQRTLERDISRINTRFKSSKCINMTYEWCMLYEGCMKRKATFQQNTTANDGGIDAKVFGKRK